MITFWNENHSIFRLVLFQVEDDLDRIRNAQSQQELMNSFKDFGRSLVELNDRAGRRQMVGLVQCCSGIIKWVLISNQIFVALKCFT